MKNILARVEFFGTHDIADAATGKKKTIALFFVDPQIQSIKSARRRERIAEIMRRSVCIECPLYAKSLCSGIEDGVGLDYQPEYSAIFQTRIPPISYPVMLAEQKETELHLSKKNDGIMGACGISGAAVKKLGIKREQLKESAKIVQPRFRIPREHFSLQNFFGDLINRYTK